MTPAAHVPPMIDLDELQRMHEAGTPGKWHALPKPGKEKYADYDRRDAARARGWAARLRAKPAAAVDDSDGVPF